MITDDLGREITHDIEVVYVAGPYTASKHTGKSEEAHVAAALAVGSDLVDLGFAPVIPHTAHYLHLLKPRPYERWMEIDQILIDRCDALLRMNAPSKGADEEVRTATDGWSERLQRNLSRPVYVFFDLDSLVTARAAYRASLTQRKS